MGEEIALEKYTVGVRQILDRLVLAVRPAHAQIEIRELFILGVIISEIGMNVNRLNKTIVQSQGLYF